MEPNVSRAQSQPEQGDSRPIEGSIWERDDELFIIESVYDAREVVPDKGTERRTTPIVLVKHRCIDPMPNHTKLEKFLAHYRPYNPERED